MNYSSQFERSFAQTHDRNTKKFKFGQVIDLEKQAKQHSKIIVRQVRLDDNQMVQVNNNKPIPYPNGFNMITKAQFDQMPQNQRAFFPWTTRPNKLVRVFFDRTQAGLDRTISEQFQKPTAVYFDDVETGHRFMEFLKFRNEQPLQRRKVNLEKIKRRWQYQVLLRYTQASVKKLELAANRRRQLHKQEQDQCVKNCQELKTYDKNIFQIVFQTLYKLAQQEESKEKERIKQRKIQTLFTHQNFIKDIETQQLRKLANYWKESSKQRLQEQEEREQLEQELLRIEEARIQAEIDAIEEEQKQISQIQQQSMIQQQKMMQHKDLHIIQFKLIVGEHIRLLNPILYVQFKPLESLDDGKIQFEKGSEVSFLNLDQKGWLADLHIILSHFKTSDVLELVVYDDYQEFNERILARVQEEETQLQAFLATAKKVLQGRISLLELEKNLNNNRRHFARLDVSADLQRNASGNQLLNVPMIQMDIYENTPFEITNSTINPFYLDIIELPITAYELKYFIRQLRNPCNSLQQQWEEFKIKALEDALQARGQIWANSKQSEDDLIEIQEYLSEEGYDNKDGKYKQLYYYLYHNKIQNQQCFVRNKLIDACMKGFTKPARVELIPILLQFSEKIKKFAEDHQLVWHENLSILEIVSEEVQKYIDEETLQFNSSKVQQYIESIKFKYNSIWTEQFIKKLQSWQQHIVRIVNGCGLIDNTQDKLLMIVRLFQLLDGRQDCDEIIYKIVRCLNYDLMLPNLSCEKLPITWFKEHMSNLFSGFFYFDVWLRVFDYIIGIGYSDGNFDKAVASVVGGIFQQINYQQYRTSEEFIIGLNIYGRLLCDPEKLIQACYDSYNNDKFEYLEKEDEFKKSLQVNPYQQIYQDQLKFLQPKQISFIIDVPEEHEGSIYDVQNSQIMLPKVGQKFVFKQQIQTVYLLIHNLYLHQISFCEQNSVTISGQHKLEQDGFFFELPYSNQLEIQINDHFKGIIDLRYYLANTIYKNTLVLDDNYDMQRHYQLSEMEYSILLKGEGVNYEQINTKDQAITFLQDQCNLFGVQHNSFQHPDAFKSASALNYVEFKQLMIQYFKLDPANINLQELYQKFILDENQSIYLLDVLSKLTSNRQQLNELINLFIPNDKINHKHLRRLGLENGDVKFLKVLISDDNYEQTVDLTDYFNSVLQNHFKKYNSYDLLLIDQNNRVYLLDNAGSFIQSFRTQMLILRIKYSSYGNIRKIQYQMNRSYKVAKELPVQATSIKELLENNQRLLTLDLNNERQQIPQTEYYKHLVYLRCRDGAKQLETCSVIGQILNKNDELQYYVVELNNTKRLIVYKEDVLLFDNISRDELQKFQKVWKQQ